MVVGEGGMTDVGDALGIDCDGAVVGDTLGEHAVTSHETRSTVRMEARDVEASVMVGLLGQTGCVDDR